MLERIKEIWLDGRSRDVRGLTLIELLVVVVILGIIASNRCRRHSRGIRDSRKGLRGYPMRNN